MENLLKCVLCFSAQLLALYVYWQHFFGHSEFFLSKDSKSTPQLTALTALHITCPTEEVAKTLSYGLVAKRFAACVNIIPKISSIYSWNGTIKEDNEVLMIVKTKQSYVSQVVQFVKQGHPFDVPEIISFDIQDGNKAYLEWVSGYVNGD